MFLTCFKINCDAFHYTWPIIQLLFGQMAHPILETLKMDECILFRKCEKCSYTKLNPSVAVLKVKLSSLACIHHFLKKGKCGKKRNICFEP